MFLSCLRFYGLCTKPAFLGSLGTTDAIYGGIGYGGIGLAIIMALPPALGYKLVRAKRVRAIYSSRSMRLVGPRQRYRLGSLLRMHARHLRAQHARPQKLAPISDDDENNLRHQHWLTPLVMASSLNAAVDQLCWAAPAMAARISIPTAGGSPPACHPLRDRGAVSY